MKKIKETRGTRLARELRTECNKMTADQRKAAQEYAMKLIYGGKQ